MSHNNKGFFTAFFGGPGQRSRTKLPKRINNRMARDIGMTPAQLERHRLELPSQSTKRPMI